MSLSFEEKQRSNNIFILLHTQSDEFLKKNDIARCVSCGGLGIITEKGYEFNSWDGMSYCSKCEGTGFVGIKKGLQISKEHFLCRNCDGSGCKKCKNGIVDWVSHLMGR